MKTENKKQNAASMRTWQKNILNPSSGRLRESNYPENLYVQRNDSHRQIQLSSGSHPTGELEVVYDALV
ncbi:TPA: hypothetical protein JD320_002110 [Citrobacter koseri]|uniref:hypothetical protein n=1 Tax=Citrobacter koseri TaxID=545 RepID=UPI001A31C968|nr:hypothetical protein [Citrobacter koseri]HDQ2604851.1 hypothetical protein [Citrobacter koseri]